MQRAPLRLGAALSRAAAAAGARKQEHWASPGAFNLLASAEDGGGHRPSQLWAAHQQARWHAVRADPPGTPQQQQEASKQQQKPTGAAARQPPRLVLYKGRWIQWVRYAVRMKVAQLVGAAGVVVGLAGLGAEDLSLLDAAVLAGVVTGSIGGSLSLWYYGRRYVGELSLLEPRRDVVRFSVLDMWGNREDVDVPLGQVQPPFRNMPVKVINHIANQLMFPVNCEVPGQGRRQFYVSVVAGQLLEGKVFMDLLQGTYVPPAHVDGAGGGSGGS